MKVIYYSKTFLADCDFPLIKELQNRGVEVCYYLTIPKNLRSDSILEFDDNFGKYGFYRASKLKCLEKYKDCIDLDNMYVIAPYYNNTLFLPSFLVWLYAIIHMLWQRADVFHITYHLSGWERLLLKFPIGRKKMMTVHDPFLHSGKTQIKTKEKQRKECFAWADALILLNNQQKKGFCDYYHIEESKIKLSRLGAYNSISHINVPDIPLKKPYILFFGLITPYKGLEYLLEAMLLVHEQCPDLRLIVAGSGDLYFDIEPFNELNYIEWRHRYIGISELIGLIKNAEFSVCPYKDATQSGVVQTSYALGTPVIVTDVGALHTAVVKGKSGDIVPPCDSQSLANTICQMHKDNEGLSNMREYIETAMASKMSWESIGQEYLSIYSND